MIDLASWNEATAEVSSSTKASLAATWHRAFSTHGLVGLLPTFLVDRLTQLIANIHEYKRYIRAKSLTAYKNFLVAAQIVEF